MADAVDSKSAGETRVGSTPTFGTTLNFLKLWEIKELKWKSFISLIKLLMLKL